MSTLNPDARVFVPSYTPISSTEGSDEDHLTQEELDELEAAEQWVQQLVGLEEMESAFLVDMALDGGAPGAPPQQQQQKAPAAAAAVGK